MNEDLLKHRIETFEKRINNHSDRIDKIEQNQAEVKVQIENLIKSIEGLINTMKWSLGFMMSGVIGFFFYAVQNHLFK